MIDEDIEYWEIVARYYCLLLSANRQWGHYEVYTKEDCQRFKELNKND